VQFFVKLQYHKQQQSRQSASLRRDRQLAAEADSDDPMPDDGIHMDLDSGYQDVFSKSEASLTA